MEGYCSICHRVWVLTEPQGLCQWCSKLAKQQTLSYRIARAIKGRRWRAAEPIDRTTEYAQLQGRWAFYYRVASVYSKRVAAVDRQDTLHDIMIELEHAECRDGEPLSELRAYRIASLMVALYWRKRSARDIPVCIYSGLPKQLHCHACAVKAGEPCAWRAVRPLLYLEDAVTDDEGYTTELKELVTDDHALDLDAWLDASQVLAGLPLRLIEIAHRKIKGKHLTENDQKYLWRWRSKAQKSLFQNVRF